jgi:hypothetical protein
VSLDFPVLLADGGIGFIVMAALSIALSAASYFLARGEKGPKQRPNFTPTTLAEQGSVLPLVIGRRRVGCILAWAGSRYTQTEETSSGGGGPFGKGGKKKKSAGQTVYYEAGWHLICVGPAKRLHRIWQEGKIIWEGPINIDDDVSGTLFVDREGGEFTIYWGEPDQPVDSILADASRVGVASRWPHVCHILWTNKRLGTSPRWPQIEYDIECEAYTENLGTDFPGMLTQVDPRIVAAEHEGVNAAYALAQVMFESYPHGIGLPMDHFSIYGADPAECTTDPITVTGGDGGFVESDNGSFDIDATVGAGSQTTTQSDTFQIVTEGWYFLDPDPTADEPSNIYINRNTNPASVTLVSALATLTKDAEVITLLDDDTSFNLADEQDHGCYPYEPAPFGPGSDMWVRGFERRYVYLTPGEWTLEVTVEWLKDAGNVGPAPFCDFAGQIYLKLLTDPVVTYLGSGSLTELATLAEEEEQVADVIAADGAEADGIIAQILQDIGALWHRDYDRDGLHAWTPIREATPLALPDNAILPTETETEVLHIERGVDRIMFKFSDKAKQYKPTVIAIDDDGQPVQTDNVRAHSVELPTAIHQAVAAKVAERRAQEELAGGAKFTVFAGRGARKLAPGRAITVGGVQVVMRLTDVKIDTDDDKVELTLIQDHYGVVESEYVAPAIEVSPGETGDPVDNERQTFLEVPAFVGERGVMNVVPLRVRGDTRMGQQVIHVSSNGTTYRETERDTTVQTGGVLTEGMAIDDSWVLEDGPTFDVEGPDLATVVEDYSADETSWRLGRQLCLIGDELFFLRNVEALGGSSYRLKGLLRARYDTERAAHAIGDAVFIFSFDSASPFYDNLLVPGQSLYVKQQAAGGGPGAVTLASVTAVNKTLVGKGIVPMKPGCLRVTAPALCVNQFATGEDVSLQWGYRSTEVPNTGAGLWNFGDAVGSSPVQGTFELQFLTTGGVLKHTENVGTDTTYDIANADLVTWFTGEPTAFVVRLRNVNGGFRSGYVERTITRV